MPNQRKQDTTSWDAKKVRQAQQGEQQTTRRRKKKKFPLGPYFLFVVVTSAILACVGWLLANDLCALDKKPVEQVITVSEGDSVSDVAQKLKEGGLIRYKGFFCLMGKFLHAKETIEPGSYKLDSEMDYRCLIQSMHNYGSSEVVSVTIPEGLTIREVFDILVENEVSTLESLEDAAANHDFVGYDFLDESKKGDMTRLEGYLFPDTYDFYVLDDPASVLSRMMDNFKARTADLKDDIANSSYSLHDLITIASLIEKESGSTSEFGNVSSVIYNRLSDGWKLQIDATINYIKGTSTLKITDEDLAIDSPYNTYMYSGLPAGPICNPGLKAIEAAVHPDSTDYWYWYATEGVTYFFTNNEEFNEFVAAHPITEE